MKKTVAILLAALLLCSAASCAAEAAVFTGSGQGNNGAIEVALTIDGGVITACEVTAHSETPGICDAALEQIPAAVISAQSAEVDAVSGATNTSRGIAQAVADAMQQAGLTTAEASAPEADHRRETSDEISERLFGEIAENQLAYAPKVRTLENGVKVQRTPYDQSIYNTYFLHSDERGCYACHDDLNEALQAMPRMLSKNDWMPSNHLHLNYVNDMQVTVDQCISCHENRSIEFNTYIHGLHQTAAFRQMGGSCESCHVVTNDGSWALWDAEKYNLLLGIVDADASVGAFTFDQTYTVSRDELFVMDWIYEANDFERYEALMSGDQEGDPELFDSWEIVIKWPDGTAVPFLLKDLIAEIPSRTADITMECVVNQISGGLIGNVTVTGIPLESIIEYAMGDEADTIRSVYVQNYVEGGGLYSTALSVDWMQDHDVLLVYEIDGQPLRVQDGYPCQVWTGGTHAGNYKKQAYELTFSTEEATMGFAEGHYLAIWPNQGIFFTQEGQIIDVAEPYTFEGFSYGYEKKIGAIEFSLDRGQTWASFATENTSDQQWVHWTYTFTPEQAGAYVLQVRSVTTDGVVSPAVSQIMVNAK